MTDPLMKDSTYNRLKEANLTVLPAVGTFYYTIAAITDLPGGDKVVAVLMAVATLNGVLLKWANSRYNNSEAKYDGDIKITPEGAIVGLAAETGFVDPKAKDAVFKVVPLADEGLPGS